MLTFIETEIELRKVGEGSKPTEWREQSDERPLFLLSRYLRTQSRFD
jgi:hypothetical protein